MYGKNAARQRLEEALALPMLGERGWRRQVRMPR